MHFGSFMECGDMFGVTQVQAFKEGFRMLDPAEKMGFDGLWLSELHFKPARSVLSSPIVVAIATRTNRLRVGIAVYVQPLSNLLRIAEELAAVCQISEGRFEFDIGRSGFARS